MNEECDIIMESCLSLRLWFTSIVMIIDERVGKKIYTRNKEAY